MTAVTTLPFGRPLTRADLEQMPEDGHRYELIDGALIVSPGPRNRHQQAVLRLAILLDAACPAQLQVQIAPFAVGLADDTEVQPDVLVARRADFTEVDLPVPPLLAVEVLSPSTRRVDLLLKRDRYQAAGIRSYWIVDPDEPSLTVLELSPQGTYVEVARTRGDEQIAVAAPYPLQVTAAALLR